MEKLKTVLEKKDLSSAWLARRVGVSRATTSRWCLGEIIPKEKYHSAIAKALGLTEEQVKEMFA